MTAALLAALLAAGAGVEPPPGAEPLGVQVRLERREARLGEPVEVDVAIRHRPEERYALAPPGPIEPFRVLSAACPRRDGGAESVTTCTLRVALYDLGPHPLPELVLRAETPAGPRALRVPGPTVVGAGILDPAAPASALRLRGPAPPAPLLVWNVPLALGALGVALAALAALLLARAWRRRALRAGEPPPPLPPDVRFARELDALEAARLAEAGRAREHFFRLSALVREYLGAVTGHAALDLTSAELLARLSLQPDPRLELGALRTFLEASDLVKFARAPAGPADADDGLRFARSLLARTRPRPAPGEGA